MENLCSDIILGQDFQQRQETVVIEYGEPLPALKVEKHPLRKGLKFPNSEASERSSCNLTTASIPPAKLFKNLRPGCKPIVTKSRKYSQADYYYYYYYYYYYNYYYYYYYYYFISS